jgi:hypothetical protein
MAQNLFVEIQIKLIKFMEEIHFFIGLRDFLDIATHFILSGLISFAQ